MGLHKFVPEEIRFLEKAVSGRSFADLTWLFNFTFDTTLRVGQIRGACNNRGLTSGLDCRFRPGQIPPNKGKKGFCPAGSEKGWFKPGHMTHNRQPVGTEIVDKDGYVKVKTRNPKTWKFKHRLIWEKARGKIPRGHVVIFADGNRRNFALDNLLLVSRAEHGVMNRWELRSADGDLTRAGKAVADLKMAIVRRKRKLKKTSRP